jgi:predicted nucleic acid-binding protein
MSKGIKNKDALHIACAIKANCHYFLTTDKKILHTDFKDITVINPLDFIKILEV